MAQRSSRCSPQRRSLRTWLVAGVAATAELALLGSAGTCELSGGSCICTDESGNAFDVTELTQAANADAETDVRIRKPKAIHCSSLIFRDVSERVLMVADRRARAVLWHVLQRERVGVPHDVLRDDHAHHLLLQRHLLRRERRPQHVPPRHAGRVPARDVLPVRETRVSPLRNPTIMRFTGIFLTGCMCFQQHGPRLAGSHHAGRG